jgi:hypothetical protein
MLMNEEGTLDLPGVNVIEGEDLRVAAERAMRLVKVLTWPHPDFVEPLYTAYTPRGRLAAVMLVTAWRLEQADAVQDGLDWRKWPLSNKETPMAGFYKALETVWAMRLFQHNRASSRTEAISVRVRGAGSKYIELQQQLRLETTDLDLSMVEIMRRSMTDDEKLIDRLIGEHEILSRELRQQQKADARAAGEGNAEDAGGVDDGDDADDAEIRAKLSRGEQVLVKGGNVGGVTARQEAGEAGGDEIAEETSTAGDLAEDAPLGGGSLLDVSGDENGSDEGVDDEGVEEVVPEGPPPEGFVRRGRDLSTKKESE